MKSQIQDYLRIGLSARHNPTSQKVHFPLIHIVVEEVYYEKGAIKYYATCLEYSQGYESDAPQDAVAGIINLMYEYFFTSIKKLGYEYLFDCVEETANEELWGKVRRFLAEKYSESLNFVQKSYENASREELVEFGKKIQDPLSVGEYISKDEHDKISSEKDKELKRKDELIKKILSILEEREKKIKELTKSNNALKNGLEGQQEWAEDRPKIHSLFLQGV
ncbi:hypothetical protein FH593_20505 (plasmid) [Leptospira interrogans]|uniref:hypothetical protein n=1 Tax=Leptospira interrogans TaxID=173 RepID=UPI0002BDD5B2|nr:hypothetical protein [Leptospira interrogans]EMN60347.1 hypothetical protein LEP1GSC092_0059 [Leptospira interrogans serovar Pyrogenes str. R168]ULG90681.1 hypothetical protein FH593_20800 [Leptospira interrogans]ULG90710.1 hypothetical protein FH593_20505 [Leptospira interrogans]UML78446.1 hypothetical protein FH583_21440 [Leptospira interrogans]